MIDRSLRRVKDRVLAAVAGPLLARLHAAHMTALSLVCCVGAAVVAALQLDHDASWSWRLVAVSLWLVGRGFDAVDGAVARTRDQTSDLGGYCDIMADTIGYAAVPLGLAIGQQTRSVWTACAVLLASFYVNTMSWTYLSALAEKRGSSGVGRITSIEMPAGLIEGAETIVLFGVMLLWPAHVAGWFMLMAALVMITALQRVVWAVRSLR